jgi:integrase
VIAFQPTMVVNGWYGSWANSGVVVISISSTTDWVPAVRTARANGLTKNPRIHDLRHTHASWLIQDGVPLFTISRRFGHTSTRTTEQVYGHLMPEALQAGADATERSVKGFVR